MNIKNRIKKIEKQMNITNSEFCACYPQRNTEIYKADLSEPSDSSEPVLMNELVPDVCPDCRKTIEKQKIILQFCDGTTKDRFPDEWKAK